MVVEAAPDYAVDIPLIWQYIGEIIGINFFKKYFFSKSLKILKVH
jgi:hypothetical protein